MSAYELRYQTLRSEGHAGWGGASHAARLAGWQARLETLAGLLPAPPARVLELGCGNGMVTALLAERGYAVVGVDLAPSAIAWARERFAEAGLEGTFVTGDVCALDDLLDGTFGLVVDSNCLHCLAGDARQRCLDTAVAHLEPRGALMISSMLGPPRQVPTGATWDSARHTLTHADGTVRTMPRLDGLHAELGTAGLGHIAYEHVAHNPWWDHATVLATR